MKRYMDYLLLCTMMGVAFAGLFAYMNTNGILIDEYISGSITITDLQIVVILIWVIFGLVLGVSKRR